MSSNIEVQRICEYCGNEFTAKTTVTKYCSHQCNRKAYKARLRANKIETSNKNLVQIKTLPIQEVKTKDILSVKDVSILLGCSIRTAYRLIENGTIKAVNLSERMTRVKRSEIDKILS